MLLRFLRARAQDPESPAAGQASTGADDLFADFDRVVRFLRKVGPPGSAQKRKEAAVKALYDMLANTVGVPDWWYELRDRVEAGEL